LIFLLGTAQEERKKREAEEALKPKLVFESVGEEQEQWKAQKEAEKAQQLVRVVPPPPPWDARAKSECRPPNPTQHGMRIKNGLPVSRREARERRVMVLLLFSPKNGTQPASPEVCFSRTSFGRGSLANGD